MLNSVRWKKLYLPNCAIIFRDLDHDLVIKNNTILLTNFYKRKGERGNSEKLI